MRTVIHGNDGILEWGTTYDDHGKHLYDWCEDLATREWLVDAIARDMQEWYDGKLLDELITEITSGSLT